MSKTSKPTNLTKPTLLFFWRKAWKYPVRVIGLLISVPAAMLVFRFLPPLVAAHVIRRISEGDYVAGDVWGSFGNDLLLYAGLTVLGGLVLMRVVIYYLWTLEMRVLQDIHEHVFDHLMAMSSKFHANRFGGSIVSQAQKLASAYVRIADTCTFQMSSLILSFIFTVIILTPRAPWVVIFLLGFSAVYIVVTMKITTYLRDLIAIESAAGTRQTGFLADAVSNIMAIKSFATAKQESRRFHQATQASRDTSTDVMRASMKRDIFFASSTTSLSTIAFILAVVAALQSQSDVATIFLTVSYAGIIADQLWNFSHQTVRNYNRAMGDAREMIQTLAIEPGVKDPAQPEICRFNRGGIRFESVTFDHEGNPDDALFKDLDLVIKPGEKVGLVGPSGSGKTTLTKLLLRYSDIQGGRITIDGQDIASVKQEDVRRYISYVPQEPLLFHRSIRENIAYGRQEASLDEIRAFAKRANAAEFIETLPDAYETLVGERGVKLSGGQRQRIAIARAMLKNAPILVLDEATSALDSESEVLIQDALWKLMEGRTAIVIAHRLSTIQKMDRIIVLQDGQIVEQGSHKELIGRHGTYARLWAHQSGGFIED